jgi:glutaconate CoA-transferase subunit B
LANTADFIVSIPELFNYWLQGGRIDMAVLGAAQIDRHGNLNTTVIGPYESPAVRLPGAGGAPEIATHAREVIVIVQHSLKAFVERLDFRTTPGNRVTAVVTDLGILEPGPIGHELMLASIHPGVSVQDVQAATGWPLKLAEHVAVTPEPSGRELDQIRDLAGRARQAA